VLVGEDRAGFPGGVKTRTYAAAGSAHHHPAAAFRTSPVRTATARMPSMRVTGRVRVCISWVLVLLRHDE
jgi:hypothetical protein